MTTARRLDPDVCVVSRWATSKTNETDCVAVGLKEANQHEGDRPVCLDSDSYEGDRGVTFVVIERLGKSGLSVQKLEEIITISF